MVRIDEPIIGDLVELDNPFPGEVVNLGLILSVSVHERKFGEVFGGKEVPTWMCLIYSLKSQKTGHYRITKGLLDSILVQRCFDDYDI